MKRDMLVLAVVSLLAIGLVSSAGAAMEKHSVTIETEIDFSTFAGTFEVIYDPDGALDDCATGTFVDNGLGPWWSSSANAKVFDCEGDGPDGFSFIFNPSPSPGPGDVNGQWVAWKGAGVFGGLRGHGDFSAKILLGESGEPIGASETLTGVVHFHP